MDDREHRYFSSETEECVLWLEFLISAARNEVLLPGALQPSITSPSISAKGYVGMNEAIWVANDKDEVDCLVIEEGVIEEAGLGEMVDARGR